MGLSSFNVELMEFRRRPQCGCGLTALRYVNVRKCVLRTVDRKRGRAVDTRRPVSCSQGSSVVSAGDRGVYAVWVSSTIDIPFLCLQTGSGVCCDCSSNQLIVLIITSLFLLSEHIIDFSSTPCVRLHGCAEIPEVLCGRRSEARG